MLVLDTNVLSELTRPKPALRVLEWMRAQPSASLYTTAVNQAEMLRGLMLLPAGKRRTVLEEAIAAMFATDFDGRLLPFGTDAAPVYAGIASARQRAGRPISHVDAQIAAIVVCAGATLATRNTRDFEGCGAALVDPWTA